MAVGDAVIVGSEHAAQRRSDTEYGKICSRYELALNAVRFAADADVHGIAPTAKHAAENRVVVAEIRVHGVGQFVRPVVGAVVISAAPKLDLNCSGFFTGKRRRRTWSIRVKMAVFAPIPRARDKTAMSRRSVTWRASAGRSGRRERNAPCSRYGGAGGRLRRIGSSGC